MKKSKGKSNEALNQKKGMANNPKTGIYQNNIHFSEDVTLRSIRHNRRKNQRFKRQGDWITSAGETKEMPRASARPTEKRLVNTS